MATSFAILAAAAVGGLVLARVLGPSGRGEVASLLLWATLALDLAMLGTAGSLAYHVAAQPDERSAAVGIVTRAAPPMVLAAVLIFGGFALAGGRIGSTPVGVLVLFALYSPLRIIFEDLQALLQGDRRFRDFNTVRLTVAALPVVGIMAVAALGRLSVATVAVVYAISLVISAGAAARAAAPLAIDTHSTRELRRSFWSYSIRNWLSLLSSKGNRSIDLLVLTIVALPAAVGTYAVATSVAGVVGIAGGSIGLVAMPRIAESTLKLARVATFKRFFLFALAGTVALCIAVLGTSGWLIPRLYGAAFLDSVILARILVVGYAAVSLSAFTGNALRGMDRPGTVAVAQFIGFLATLGALGLAWSADAVTVAIAAGIGFWVTLAIEVTAIVHTLRAEP